MTALPRITPAERRQLRNAQRRVNRARGNPIGFTCPASRHLHEIADAIARGDVVRVADEPGHCALTMYAVLEALWKARAR